MRDDYLTLAIAEGFDERPIAALLEPGQTPAEILASPPEPPAVPPRVARRLRHPDLAQQAAAVRQRAEVLGMRVATPTDGDWPTRMNDQPQRPLVLFARGDLEVASREPAAAIVGSRTPTPYGIDAAKDLAAALARAGTVLWSGLARGIDAIAHEACLAAGQPTVAVVAGGLDHVYPPEHRQLADRIVAGGGCVLSELPPGRRARRGHFLRRNRLLAAGPTVVLVVEGSLASGALHTARFAADCSTEVFAIPGPWRSERSRGCHRLIAEGAGIVENHETLLHALGLAVRDPRLARDLAGTADQAAILAELQSGPRPTDLLRRETGLAKVAFLQALFALQQLRAIERLPGDLWRSVTNR